MMFAMSELMDFCLGGGAVLLLLYISSLNG